MRRFEDRKLESRINSAHRALCMILTGYPLSHSCMCFVYVCVNTCIHIYMHACMQEYIHTYINARMHACMHAYMHVCTHTYIHAHIHACMPVESTERISEIWCRETFPGWGFLRFRVRVSFTYGWEFTRSSSETPLWSNSRFDGMCMHACTQCVHTFTYAALSERQSDLGAWIRVPGWRASD